VSGTDDVVASKGTSMLMLEIELLQFSIHNASANYSTVQNRIPLPVNPQRTTDPGSETETLSESAEKLRAQKMTDSKTIVEGMHEISMR